LTHQISVLWNPKAALTPYFCRKGWKHYDRVKDGNGG
jgi:hypothetical protein